MNSEKQIQVLQDVTVTFCAHLINIAERLQILEAQNNIDRNESTSSPPPPAPIKRGRGRPKKNA